MLSGLLQEAQKGYSEDLIQQDKVFQQIYIPRSLQEFNHEDIIKQQKWGVEQFHQKLTGAEMEITVAPEEEKIRSEQDQANEG